MTDNYDEKRKYKRVSRQFIVNYKLMPKDSSIEAMRKESKSHDISAGGVRIEGDALGEIEDVLRIEFKVEGLQQPITTFAEIKWKRKIDDKDFFGVEFLALKKSDQEAIEKIVSESD